eukprot:GHVS01091795.1.p1 GENE.GHVS01091795.1~~GHVS01091795.1.p1  ORF type:complete len:544 (-),score=82.82 GHVS01091795.1:106-1737(-)
MATLVNFVPVFCLPRCPLRHCRPLSSLATHGNSWHGIVQAQFVQELREWYHQKSNKSMWHVWNKTRMVMAYTRPFPSFVAPPLSQWYFPMPSSSAPASVFFPNGPISHYAAPCLQPFEPSPTSPSLSSSFPSSSFPSSSLIRLPLCTLDISPSGHSGHWLVGRALQRPQEFFVAITADPKQAFSLLVEGVRGFEMDPLNLQPFPNLRIIISHPKLVDKFFPMPLVADVLLSMNQTTGCSHSFTNNHHGIYDLTVTRPSSPSSSPFAPAAFSSFSPSCPPKGLTLSPSLFRHIARVMPPHGCLHLVTDNRGLVAEALGGIDNSRLQRDTNHSVTANANSLFVCLSPGSGYSVGTNCASVLGGLVNSQQDQTVTKLVQHTALYYDHSTEATEERTDTRCSTGGVSADNIKAWGRGRVVIVDGSEEDGTKRGDKTTGQEEEEGVNFCNVDGSISIRIRSRRRNVPLHYERSDGNSSTAVNSNTSEPNGTAGVSSNVVTDECGLVYYSRWMRTRPSKPNFRLNSQSVIVTSDVTTRPFNKRPIPLSW